VRVVELPETDGFRPIKHGLRDLDEVGEGPTVYAWDAYAPAAGFGPV